MWWLRSLCCHEKLTRFCFQHTVGTKITNSEFPSNTQDFSSMRVPTAGVTYPQRYFRQVLSAWEANKFCKGVKVMLST